TAVAAVTLIASRQHVLLPAFRPTVFLPPAIVKPPAATVSGGGGFLEIGGAPEINWAWMVPSPDFASEMKSVIDGSAPASNDCSFAGYSTPPVLPPAQVTDIDAARKRTIARVRFMGGFTGAGRCLP